MVDLLLPRQSRQPLHSNKPTTAFELKAEARPLHKARSDGSLLSTVSRSLKGANNYWLSWKDGLTSAEREKLRFINERKQVLALRLTTADSRQQWQSAAEELDALEGNDEWKRDPLGADYNTALIEQRLRALDDARINCDLRSMMHLLRTDLSRDLGGMDNVDLYRHSYTGTKSLIERYVQSTLDTIDAVVVQSAVDEEISCRDLLEGMLLARQSYGRSALLLSGGGTFGMCHIGVLKALFDANLLPRIISGASAGSIVCAVVCTRTDEEIPALIQEFAYGDLAVFGTEDINASTLDHLRRLFTEGSWSDIKHLTRLMRKLTGDMTFQEAYNRSRRILNICVSTESIYELPRLLNYVTAPNVMIWSAVAASCSVPLVFHASPLLMKDPLTGEHQPWNPSPQRFIDGSVDNDLPMTRLAEMFNVNHFIVSQVNPHVVPFLAKDGYVPPDGRTGRFGTTQKNETDWINTFASLAKDEALHRLQFMAELGIMPNLMTKLQSILSQKYSGDITILPEIRMNDLPLLLSNPNSDFMLRSSLLGERATWPRLSRIRDRCATELALDRAVHLLRTRVVFSESQRDLRTLDVAGGRSRLHHPVSISLHPAELAQASPRDVYQTHRRRSGGSLSTLADRQVLLGAVDNVTDEDTMEEERLELEARRTRPAQSPALRKPRLKRASKSQIHVSRHTSRLTSFISPEHDVLPTYDFSKPLTPPTNTLSASPREEVVEEHQSSDTSPDPNLHDPWLNSTSPYHDQSCSPMDEQETSEQGQSSDADVDQATEESDPEPYDTKWESAAAGSTSQNQDDSMFGPEGRIGNGAWE